MRVTGELATFSCRVDCYCRPGLSINGRYESNLVKGNGRLACLVAGDVGSLHAILADVSQAFAPETWPTWVNVLVGIVVAFIYLRTLRAIEKQTVANHKSAEAAHR